MSSTFASSGSKTKTSSSSSSSAAAAFKSNRLVQLVRRHRRIAGVVGAMILLLPLLGLLALRNNHGGGSSGRGTVRAEFTSPVVYPSPRGYGAGNWSAAYDKARAMVSNMTLNEMNNLTYGYAVTYTGCVGVSGSALRVGFPGLCLQDAGNGVRDTDGVSSYASGVHVGASWNATMAYERGRYMGAEFKKKGANVALGPVVGPIGRIAEGGRNWEGFAADPYADGVLAAMTVRGVQAAGVIASVKHFVAYEQETNRNPDGSTMSTSANVDDQTMHEVYLWPFQDAVAAGVGCVMCSYNRINQTYACENSKTMNGLLKGELDFQGFVVSDWTGQHSGIPSANAGLDMAMPTSTFWDESKLADAVSNGTLNRTRLVDMATRIVATWYQVGQDDPSYPPLGFGLPHNLLEPHKYVDAKDPASRGELLQEAIEGHVLVKNNNSALPLNLSGPATVLSLFGYDAVDQATFNPAPQNLAGQSLDFFALNWQGISLGVTQLIALGSNAPVPSPPETYPGTLIVGGGSGSNTPAYISSPYEAIVARAQANGSTAAIFHDFSSNTPNVVASSSACLVFVNEFASESWDRPGLADPTSDKLVASVAGKCNNTVVVVHNAGARVVDAWIENPNVTAVLFAHLPGQEAGTALARILFGDVSPSGRLPYTVAKQASDYGGLLAPCQAGTGVDASDPQCDFTEGVDIDYRSFLARNVTPRFEFGYGLTYASFDYSGLAVSVNATATNTANGTTASNATGATNAPVYANGTTTQNNGTSAVGVGGLLSLFDSVGSVAATIKNTGKVAAAEVAQLYLVVPAPSEGGYSNGTTTTVSHTNTRALRGFEKILLKPGDSANVTFNLRRKDVSYWDSGRQEWIVPKGQFGVFVGRSVLDVPLQGTFST